MQLFGKLATKRLALLPAGLLVVSTVPMFGCGGATIFQGKSNQAVMGDLPAPPPPPPAKEEPAKPKARVVLTKDKIEIGEKIQFGKASAEILPVSFGLMDEIYGVMDKNPQVKKIRIEGHASAEGPAAYNKDLSDRRAKAVMKYLVDKGIKADRLTAQGFGIEKPIADNGTEEGREKNRRVEFNIVEQTNAAQPAKESK
jgi:OOP family OmpA-OmpF porin